MKYFTTNFTWDELVAMQLFVGRCPVNKSEEAIKKLAFDAIKRELPRALIGPSLPIRSKKK